MEINNQAVEFDLHRAVLAKQVKAWYEAIFVCAAFILLVKLAISRSVPLSVPFAVLVVFQGSCLIRSTLAILRNTSPESQKITKREILIQLFTFLFYIYMTVRIYLPNPNLIYSVIPLSFSNLVYALYKVDYKYKIQEFSVRLEYSIKLSLSFTLLFTGLKETKVIPWNWFYVFWPIWVDALILALIATGQLMNGFRLIRLSCKNQGNCMDSIGPFWLSYCLYGLAICFSYLFISIARDKGLDWANTSSALLTLLIYFIGLFVITFLFNSILL